MPTRANPVVTLFPLLLAGLLAGMSYWLELATRPLATDNDGKLRHDPDYIVDKFAVRRFDLQGNLQHTLVADQMRHYPDDDSTVIQAPRLTYHRTPPTVVTAREARLDSAGKHIELIDDVRVTRAGAAGKADTVLTTARLHAYPDDETATTSVPVTIVQGPTHVNGSGLNVDNKTSVYVLEGPVRGVFFRNRARLAEVPPESLPQALPKPTPTNQAKPQPGAKPRPKSKPASRR